MAKVCKNHQFFADHAVDAHILYVQGIDLHASAGVLFEASHVERIRVSEVVHLELLARVAAQALHRTTVVTPP